jgi:hypothetical protein
MIVLVVANITILALVSLAVFASQYVLTNSLLLCVFAIVSFSALMIPYFAAGAIATEIANYRAPQIKDFFIEFTKVWKDALLYGALLSTAVIVAFTAIRFYFSFNNLFAFFLSALLFWLLAIIVLSLQWFIPLRFLLKNDFRKCIKKSFIIFFDNAGFSIAYFFYQMILAVLSVPLVFIGVSFSGILLAQINALRLRLYKYDWRDAHPELSPAEAKHIPWDELLADERDTVGTRSLKNFIFPWKD